MYYHIPHQKNLNEHMKKQRISVNGENKFHNGIIDSMKFHHLKRCECSNKEGSLCIYMKKILNLKLGENDKENEKMGLLMSKLQIFRKSTKDILSSSERIYFMQ